MKNEEQKSNIDQPVVSGRAVERRPYKIVCRVAFEFEGHVFNVGDISENSFGYPPPDRWDKATQKDLDAYYNRKR